MAQQNASDSDLTRWAQLKATVRGNKTNRYGMVYPTQRRTGDGKRIFLCNACGHDFTDYSAARLHPCPLEKAFRELTGRKLPVVQLPATQARAFPSDRLNYTGPRFLSHTLAPEWSRLKRGPKSRMASCRWGMLAGTSLEEREGGKKCYCYACGRMFGTWDMGRAHPCSREEYFRRATGRPRLGEYPIIKIGHRYYGSDADKPDDQVTTPASLPAEPSVGAFVDHLLAKIKSLEAEVERLRLSLDQPGAFSDEAAAEFKHWQGGPLWARYPSQGR